MASVALERRAPGRRLLVEPEPEPAVADTSQTLTRSERQALRLLKIAIVLTLVLQRVLLPGGVPAVVPIIYVLVLVLWRRGLAFPDPRRVFLYLAALGACCLAATLSSLSSKADPSVTSLGLLVVTYVPLCWVMSGDTQRIFRAVLSFFVKVMLFFAVVAIVEWFVQVLGWKHEDFLSDIFPSNWLYADFNTNYPIKYGSPILKSNAFVFDEPSVCSQFLALGLLAQLHLGVRWGRLVLFAAAMVATVSGTGIIILIVGLLAFAISRGFRFAVATVALAAVAVVGLALTPAGDLFGERAGETSSQGSSGNLRFVQPYQRVYDINLQGSLSEDLVGLGPGAGDRDAQRYILLTGLPLISPTIPKLAVEYGLPAMALFMAFFLVTLGARPPTVPFAIALFVFFGVLQGALLLPLMPFTCMLLSTLYPRPAPVQRTSGARPAFAQPARAELPGRT